MKREIKYLEANRNTPHQNLWDVAKAILRGKFTVIKACYEKRYK